NGYQLRGIECMILCAVLLSALLNQVTRYALVVQLIEVKANAHAISGGRAPVTIQFEIVTHRLSPVTFDNGSLAAQSHRKYFALHHQASLSESNHQIS